MKIGSIIAEYNPFHNGHKYQIEQYKKEKKISHLVVAMSGNFVQRGAPAIFDKFSRAEMAIAGGADLVIEIPTCFATQTAELYARGAILSLDALGCLDSICFGAEEKNIKRLKEVAEVLVYRKEEYENILTEFILEKKTFPIAREKAIKKILGIENCDFLSMSNNILAIEYLKELLRINSNIEAFSIQRKGVLHNSVNSVASFKSATAIRKELSNVEENFDKLKKTSENKAEFIDDMLIDIKKYLPISSKDIIKENILNGIYPMDLEVFFDEICYSILREEDSLEKYFEVKEGIENSIRKKITRSYNLEEIIGELTSPRYTSSKIRRTLFNIFLALLKDDMEKIRELRKIPYIRVLAFNKRGTEILKEVKNKSNALIAKSPAKTRKSCEYKNNIIFKKMFDFDIRSSNIYYQKYYRNRRDILKKGEPDFIRLGYMLEDK